MSSEIVPLSVPGTLATIAVNAPRRVSTERKGCRALLRILHRQYPQPQHSPRLLQGLRAALPNGARPGNCVTWPGSSRCTSPPTSRNCWANWRSPRSNSISPRSGCFSIGSWLAMPSMSIRLAQCADRNTSSRKAARRCLIAMKRGRCSRRFDTSSFTGDRALIGTMIYTFARVGTRRPTSTTPGDQWMLRFEEKAASRVRGQFLRPSMMRFKL
jgi:hypothetical protein